MSGTLVCGDVFGDVRIHHGFFRSKGRLCLKKLGEKIVGKQRSIIKTVRDMFF